MLGTAEKEKKRHISNILLWTRSHGHTSVGQPVKTYIYQHCVNIGYHLEDLPSMMADRNGRQERVKEIWADDDNDDDLNMIQ